MGETELGEEQRELAKAVVEAYDGSYTGHQEVEPFPPSEQESVSFPTIARYLLEQVSEGVVERAESDLAALRQHYGYESKEAFADAVYAAGEDMAPEEDDWFYCPRCVEEIEEAVDNGTPIKDIDRDPRVRRLYDGGKTGESQHSEKVRKLGVITYRCMEHQGYGIKNATTWLEAEDA